MKQNNPLKYSNCWEDALLLNSSLNIDKDSKVMSIASAGDNSLMLLTGNPKEMLCLDMNEIQLWVTQLKEQAIKLLDYQEFLQLMGFQSCDDRIRIYQKVYKELSPDARNFFTTGMIEGGIIHQGKFEKYFQLFAHKVLPLIHTKKRIKALFEGNHFQESNYEHFYTKKWNTLRWRLFFKIFFSRYVMGKFGREPEKLQEVKGKVGDHIFNQAEKHLKSSDRTSNYMLEYTLTGKFKVNLPPYAQERYFNKTKAWLQTKRIQYFYGNLEQCLAQHSDFNRFNLSNIFEYMPSSIFNKQAGLLHEKSASNAIYSYWNLMVSRTLNDNKGYSRIENTQRDHGFFYQEFHNYTRTT
jgi:S-adenosylmethionine-diacylglycerol 3-amino-3-carboxypropyl transferase